MPDTPPPPPPPKPYEYRATTQILSGGYPFEEHGVYPVDSSWHKTTNESGSATYTYFYRDSNSLNNANSSRVDISITDSWTVDIDNKNVMTVTVSTTINSITRGTILGNPLIGGGAKRHIRLFRDIGGGAVADFNNDAINYAHSISGSVSLGSHTFTLKPGEGTTRGTVYVLNQVPGYENIALPNIYTDALWVGMAFKNILSKDYRPGKILKPDGEWYSCNRDDGFSAVRKNAGGWKEVRTDDGGAGTNNPPKINHNGTMKNMRKIGKNAE